MAEMDSLNLMDIAVDGPHTKHLVRNTLEKAMEIGKEVKLMRNAVADVCKAQTMLCNAYKKLSTAISSSFTATDLLHEPGEELKQMGFQFCGFMEELIEINQTSTSDLETMLLGSLTDYSVFMDSLQTESNDLDVCDKTRDQVYHNYMKLPKKCGSKVLQSSLLELAALRREFGRAATLHYGHLNEAERLRKIVPLTTMTKFLSAQTGYVESASQLFGKPAAIFLTVIQSSLDKQLGAEKQMSNKFMDRVRALQLESLSSFNPEIEIPILDSVDGSTPSDQLAHANRELKSKSGRLLMRTRVNLVPRWVDVFCFTQSGNLMSQQYGELGASLLLDLNHKGVYTEVADYDDRRNVFHIVSPTEKKTIVLQAESHVERDEWMFTLTNIFFDVHSLDMHRTGIGSNDDPKAMEVQVNSPTTDRPGKQNTAVDWSASCLPEIQYDLPTYEELNVVRDTELIQVHQIVPENTEQEKSSSSTPSGSNPVSAETFVSETESILDPVEMCFLGSITLSTDFEYRNSNQLNDVFSYILSCRSGAGLPNSFNCQLLITKRDMWLLAPMNPETADAVEKTANSGDRKRANVLVRIPFTDMFSFVIYPDNTRLACILCQSRAENSPPNSEQNRLTCYAFESDNNNLVTERLLAAHLERIELLYPAVDEKEKNHLMNSISRLSEISTPDCSTNSGKTDHGTMKLDNEVLPGST